MPRFYQLAFMVARFISFAWSPHNASNKKNKESNTSPMLHSDIFLHRHGVQLSVSVSVITNESAKWATKCWRDNLLSVSLADPREKK